MIEAAVLDMDVRPGLFPGKCAAFEDSPNGVRPAHAAGMPPIMALGMAESGRELQRLLCGKFGSLSEIEAFFRRRGGYAF